MDVLTMAPPAPIEQLALRIGAAGEERGRLLVKIAFADKVPPQARLHKQPTPKAERVRIEIENVAESGLIDFQQLHSYSQL